MEGKEKAPASKEFDYHLGNEDRIGSHLFGPAHDLQEPSKRIGRVGGGWVVSPEGGLLGLQRAAKIAEGLVKILERLDEERGNIDEQARKEKSGAKGKKAAPVPPGEEKEEDIKEEAEARLHDAAQIVERGGRFGGKLSPSYAVNSQGSFKQGDRRRMLRVRRAMRTGHFTLERYRLENTRSHLISIRSPLIWCH